MSPRSELEEKYQYLIARSIILDVPFMLTVYNGNSFGCVIDSGKTEECGKQCMHKNAISPHFVAFEN